MGKKPFKEVPLSEASHLTVPGPSAIGGSAGALREDMEQALSLLSPDQLAVVNRTYGLKDGVFLTVTQIAEALNQTEQWVEEQHSSALRLLRTHNVSL